MPVRCPHCGHSFSGYHKRRDYEALQRGECVDCGAMKSDKDLAAGRWRCVPCRGKRAGRMAMRRGGRNEQVGSRVTRPNTRAWK